MQALSQDRTGGINPTLGDKNGDLQRQIGIRTGKEYRGVEFEPPRGLQSTLQTKQSHQFGHLP